MSATSTDTPTTTPLQAPRPRRRVPVRLVVFAVLAVVVVVAFAWLLSWYSPVPVRAVTVTGASPAKQAEILTAAGISTGTAIRDIDTTGVTERVVAVPGVEAVDVVLQRPFTVDLVVLERVPFAATQSATGWVVLDQRGDVISEQPDRPQGLPAVTGPDARAGVVALAAMSPELRGRVKDTTVSPTGDIAMALDDGTAVDWGRTGEDELKARVVQQLLAYAPKSVSVAVPQRPAVTGDLDLPKENRLPDSTTVIP